MEMTSLERELICPLCQDYFTTPLSLPCQHNVCHRCAKDQVVALANQGAEGATATAAHSSDENLSTTATSPTTSMTSLPGTPSSRPITAGSLRASFRRRATLPVMPSSAGVGTPMKALPREMGSGRRESLPAAASGLSPRGRPTGTGTGSAHQPTTFFCPTCRENIDLGDKGLNGLYRNFALEVIVDRFKLAAKKAASIPCNLCKVRPPLDATKSCLDCKLSYCNECYKHHHPWGTPRAQHEHIGPTHNFRPKQITCTEHTNEKVTMYCDGCQKPVCHRCKFSGAHAKHKMSVIERKYTVVKEKMESHLAAIRGKRDEIKKGVDNLTGLCEKVEANGALAKEQLRAALAKLQASLDDRSGALTRATEAEITRRVEAVRTQLATYRDILQGCSVVDLAVEMLKETDKACFVQAARPILGRLMQTVGVIKEAELSPVHAFDDFNNLSIDDGAAAEALSKLNFHQAPDAPTICTKRCQSYNHVVVEWDPPTTGGKSPAATYTLEYRKIVRAEGSRPPTPTNQRKFHTVTRLDTAVEDLWTTVEGISQCRYQLNDLEPDSRYKFRVRGENRAGKGESSKIVVIRTVPAPVLSFKWTSCQPNGTQGPTISKDGHRVSLRPSPNLFSPTGSPMPSSPVALAPAFCLGDRRITSGSHYWEVVVDQSPCAVQIGVISERRSRRLGDPSGVGGGGGGHTDGDSGHDSCDELDAGDHGSRADPTVLINYHAGRVYLPSEPCGKHGRKTGTNGNKHTAHALASCTVGVSVDVDKKRVTFFDGETKESFFSSSAALEGAVYPGIVIIGPGVVKSRQMDELSLGGVNIL